jgi:hypothetical protein
MTCGLEQREIQNTRVTAAGKALGAVFQECHKYSKVHNRFLLSQFQATIATLCPAGAVVS